MTIGRMPDSKRPKVPEEVVAEESAALKRIWIEKKAYRIERCGSDSQEAFGHAYNIGNQAAVGQFINGKTALSLKAAAGFSRGLGVPVEDFSPRLAVVLPVPGAEESPGPGAAPGELPPNAALRLANAFDEMEPGPEKVMLHTQLMGLIRRAKLRQETRAAREASQPHHEPRQGQQGGRGKQRGVARAA